MLKKLIRYAFVGSFTKENIPNKKVRHMAIQGVYLAAFYSLRAQYLSSKLEMVAETGKTQITFRDWLHYNSYEGTANFLDQLDEKLSDHVRNNYPQSVPDFGYGSNEYEVELIRVEEHEDLEF